MDSREIGRLRQKCFSFGKTLLACKRDFRFSLRVGSFEMSLGADGASGRKAGPGCGRKRNPAYFRRQKRRRQAFLEKRGLASDSLGIGAETVVGGTRDGEGGEEVGGREQEQKEEVTLEDVCRLAVELSEINNQRSCEISELLNDTKNLLNSWTANQRAMMKRMMWSRETTRVTCWSFLTAYTYQICVMVDSCYLCILNSCEPCSSGSSFNGLMD